MSLPAFLVAEDVDNCFSGLPFRHVVYKSELEFCYNYFPKFQIMTRNGLTPYPQQLSGDSYKDLVSMYNARNVQLRVFDSIEDIVRYYFAEIL